MKNQYFGDINDYHKYGLLRVLSDTGVFGTGVCWMLTSSDWRTDGQKLSYLDRSWRWERFDPELFDHLYRCVRVEGRRDVTCIEDARVLPGAVFYAQPLSDAANERRLYFVGMLEHFRDKRLVFFDPDNGLEVPSKPFGRKGSSKYLYWHELANTYSVGHSVLVYQHFPRQERSRFIKRVAEEIQVRTGAAATYAFQTPNVVFFLAAQSEHEEHFGRQARRVSNAWRGQIEVCRYPDD